MESTETTWSSISDVTPVADFQCTDYNTISAWRVAEYIDINASEYTNKLCTCWYNSHLIGAQTMISRPAIKTCADTATAITPDIGSHVQMKFFE